MKFKKRALMFEVLMFFIILIILTTAFFVLYQKYSKFSKNFELGERQFSLISTYQNGEKVLFYIDQSAKYSLQQSVYELAQNGGSLEIKDVEEMDTSGKDITELGKIPAKNQCGKFNGLNVWYEIKREQSGGYTQTSCFDEKSLTNNLEYIFNENLNEYLLNHPYNILLDNYNYEIKGSLEIIGKAIAPIKFDILRDETKLVEKKPEEVRIPEEAQNFVDFTGTKLCKKGEKCLLSKEASNLLLKAQEIAVQKGVSLEVTSGYRTLQEQTALWKRNPDRRYVCPPSTTCPHLSGNVVDVRFKGKTINTMTKKDWQLLHEIMSEADWVRYAKENWHFECCGTPRYAKAKATGVTIIV